jgi:hypothetical protein
MAKSATQSKTKETQAQAAETALETARDGYFVPTLDNIRWTPTQQRIMDVLADGEEHARKEILQTIDSQIYVARGTLSKHLWIIRKLINPYGHDIICRSTQYGVWYRHVIRLPLPLSSLPPLPPPIKKWVAD